MVGALVAIVGAAGGAAMAEEEAQRHRGHIGRDLVFVYPSEKVALDIAAKTLNTVGIDTTKLFYDKKDYLYRLMSDGRTKDAPDWLRFFDANRECYMAVTITREGGFARLSAVSFVRALLGLYGQDFSPY